MAVKGVTGAMGSGIFSRIEAEKYLEGQASLADVFYGTVIDRSLGQKNANAFEEISHAWSRNAGKSFLSGIFDILLSGIFFLCFLVIVLIRKISLLRFIVNFIGFLVILTVPCFVFMYFNSYRVIFTIFLICLFLLYVLYVSGLMKTFYSVMAFFLISVFIVVDVTCLHIFYVLFEKYCGTWMTEDKAFLLNVDADRKMYTNVMKNTQGAKYVFEHGYNFIFLGNKKDKKESHLFLFFKDRLIYDPFGEHRKIFKKA